MNPKTIKPMRFALRYFALACSAAVGLGITNMHAAIAVGATGSSVQTFDTLPASTSWSTKSWTGAAGDLVDTAGVDAAVQLLASTDVPTTLGTSGTNPPSTNALARQNTTLKAIQTRPTGVKGCVLMATLQNTSGGATSLLEISYDFAKPVTGTEEVPGLRAYYSLTGLAGSWTVIPDLCTSTAGALSTVVTLSSPWSDATTMYVLWVDDNSAAAGDAYTLDNVVFGFGADIKTFIIPPGGDPTTYIGNNIDVYLPTGSDVTALEPTFTLSNGASCLPASGSPQDFTSPVHYVVTSSDTLITRDYTVTVIVGPVPVYLSNAIGPLSDGGLNIDPIVGAGTSGLVVGYSTTYWNSHGFTRPVILSNNTLEVNSGGGNEPFGAHGSISGNGAVIYDTVLAHRITVDAENTYSGTTLIRRGWVQMGTTADQTNLLGTITVGGTSAAKLVWGADNQIDDASDVTLAISTTYLDLAGFDDTINDLYLVTGTSVETGVGGVLKVSRLFINGVQQDDVAKIAGDGYVFGSGYIEVGASGPPVIESAPAEPVTPTPADLATTVHPAALQELDWADSAGATSYDVYLVLASDPDPEPGVTTPTANVALSKHTLGSQVLSLTDYKWQVVAKNGVGDTPGPLWTFSTVDRTLVAGNFSSDYSDFTHNLNYIVGVGNSGTLQGNFRVHWSGGQGSFSVPVDTNGFILDADTGGGNGGHNASGAISGGGSLVITHGPHYNGTWDNPYTISGAASNTYSGGTLIKRGRVILNKTAGVDALPATAITLGSTGTTARLEWGASDQINDLAEISVLLPTVSDGATADANMNYLDLAGHSDTIASLTLPDDGTKTQVRTGAGGVLTVATLMVNGELKGPGPYTSADGFITGSGSVVVAGAGVTFASWAASKGLVDGDADFDADPDGDGIDNSIEFVIGGEPNPANPGSNSTGLLPTVEAQGDNLVITFTLMDEAAYLNPVIEFNANLQGEWTTAVDPDNATIDIAPGSPADTITVTIPKGANLGLFARLKVVEP